MSFEIRSAKDHKIFMVLAFNYAISRDKTRKKSHFQWAGSIFESARALINQLILMGILNFYLWFLATEYACYCGSWMMSKWNWKIKKLIIWTLIIFSCISSITLWNRKQYSHCSNIANCIIWIGFIVSGGSSMRRMMLNYIRFKLFD